MCLCDELHCEHCRTELDRLSVLCCVAVNLLSLALDTLPQCVARLVSHDVSRADKVTDIIETLMTNGAVLLPYPCMDLTLLLMR